MPPAIAIIVTAVLYRPAFEWIQFRIYHESALIKVSAEKIDSSVGVVPSFGMRIVSGIANMQRLARSWKASGIGLVPTMGYLHEGHISLTRRARKAVGAQ